MICKIDFDALPDNAQIVKAKAMVGEVTYDARHDENDRKEIIIKNTSIKDLKKIIKSKKITELNIEVITWPN
jgi:hypothetical protein